MRDKKISILLSVSFLLLLASFLILCTWVYHYYTSDKVISKTKNTPVSIRSEVTRDSLLKIYTTTIQSMENQLGTTYSMSDSLEFKLGIKLDEYYRLKDEVAILLKKPASDDDFTSAKHKISTLQQKIKVLRSTSSDIEEDNKRLYHLLAQLKKEAPSNVQNVQFIESNNDIINTKPSSEKSPIVLFSTSDLSLNVLKDIEQDVFSTQRKIEGSFTLHDAKNIEGAEVMVVVTQPNGVVLQKSAWESGTFQSRNGKKIYSLKMRLDDNPDDAKKISFSIVTEKFITGKYTMELYNMGIVSGRISKVLY